ncbi:UDP-glucuronosyl/UDP-glucosyltransferase [Artemisia annua]|uniref:Glycosyltransferase n=1 Tax=Artemisia annua TaxID=35608 RepID=A0A2U1M466_ARTAN|nr:UDP-glucuronosyl/UDP-glucosyltransferase [Artemisia annua]
MKRAQVAIIASPSMGNLVPVVEFATHIINHDSCLSVTVLVISVSHWGPLLDDYIQSCSSTEHIRFIQLHTDHMPQQDQYSSGIEFISLHIQNHRPIVKQTLQNLTKDVPLVGFFVDMFCTSMIDDANDLNIPCYLFFASPAAYLGFVLHLTTLPVAESESDLATEITVQSFINPVPSNAYPLYCIKKNQLGFSCFVNHARRYKETKGIIVNTFQELEPYTLDSLSSKYVGLPPVYPVGPIIDHDGPVKWHANRSSHEKINEWLDQQPSLSVVFLCFGSMGSLNRAQLLEIATGLERTGYRFLWAIREPPKRKLELPNDYENLDDKLFPDGFLNRTAGRGLVCGWVSQVSVLAHKAIGGFVSHCGWNSILESIWYGVPIAAWPLYGEQHLNAFEMVKELGLSSEIRLRSGDKDCDDLVLAEEVERSVKELMDGTDGELRKKVKEMSEKSKKALMKNGSSFEALEDLIKVMLSEV